MRAASPSPHDERRAGNRGARLASVLLVTVVSWPSACACGDGDPLDDVVYALRAAETTLDFGAVPIGAVVERSTFVINDGTAPIELAEPPRIDGDGRDAYLVVEPGAYPLAPEDFTELVVRFAPVLEGEARAEVVIAGVVAEARAAVTLVGRGVAPDVVLAPEVVDLGAVEAGLVTSATMTVTNTGEAPLSVRLAVDGRGFTHDDGSTARVVDVAAGVTVDVTLRFAPDRGGPFSARLVAETCGALCGPSVELVGEGIAPRIAITPRPIELGDVAVAETGRVTVTIENAGVGNLVVSALSLVDPLGALTLESPELPVVMDGTNALEVDVVYAPTAPEGDYVASLLVDSSDPLQPRVTVPISATTDGPRLRLVPSALHFGLLDPGDTRSADVLAISTGTVPVSVGSAVVVGEAFTLAALPPSVPGTLAPGESVLLTVVAEGTPTAIAEGGASGSFVVTTDDGESVTAALTLATGTEGCQPRALSENLNLGYVRIGQGAQGVIVVENVGTGDCTLTFAGPRLGLSYDAGFTHAVTNTALPPGGTLELRVAYQANVAAQAKAFIDLLFAEQPAPLLVSATATGVDGALVAVPPSLALGPVIVGCADVDQQTVSFINEGSSPVTITAVSLDPPTTAATIFVPNLPATVAPGTFFNVGVATTAAQAGLVVTSLVATTDEVGPVSAAITIETSPTGLPVTEQFTVADVDGRVDVLFIVDDSGSMEDDQAILAANFETFIEAAANSGTADFHIGVTSTDVLTPGALAGRLAGSPPVLTPSTPSLVNAFATRAALGTFGTGLELGLEAMRFALSEPLASSDNAGFHRVEAALSVVIVSDEDDSGPGMASLGFPQHDLPVESYIAFLDALKGGVLTEAPVLFNAVVHPTFSPRYTALAGEYGGVVLDITSETWGDELTRIADATFALQRLFRLTTPPIAGSVNVLVDGQPAAFTLDANGNVVLDEAPPPQSQVEITYVPDC